MSISVKAKEINEDQFYGPEWTGTRSRRAGISYSRSSVGWRFHAIPSRDRDALQ